MKMKTNYLFYLCWSQYGWRERVRVCSPPITEPEVAAATPPIQLTCAHCYKRNDLRKYGLSEQVTEGRKWVALIAFTMGD